MQFAGEPVHSRQRYSNNLLIRDFDRNASVREKEEEEGEEERERERDRSRTRLGRYLGTRDSRHAASRRFSRQQLVTETDLSADWGERGNERVEREEGEREREGPELKRSWQSLEARNE